MQQPSDAELLQATYRLLIHPGDGNLEAIKRQLRHHAQPDSVVVQIAWDMVDAAESGTIPVGLLDAIERAIQANELGRLRTLVPTSSRTHRKATTIQAGTERREQTTRKQLLQDSVNVDQLTLTPEEVRRREQEAKGLVQKMAAAARSARAAGPSRTNMSGQRAILQDLMPEFKQNLTARRASLATLAESANVRATYQWMRPMLQAVQQLEGDALAARLHALAGENWPAVTALFNSASELVAWLQIWNNNIAMYAPQNELHVAMFLWPGFRGKVDVSDVKHRHLGPEADSMRAVTVAQMLQRAEALDDADALEKDLTRANKLLQLMTSERGNAAVVSRALVMRMEAKKLRAQEEDKRKSAKERQELEEQAMELEQQADVMAARAKPVTETVVEAFTAGRDGVQGFAICCMLLRIVVFGRRLESVLDYLTQLRRRELRSFLYLFPPSGESNDPMLSACIVESVAGEAVVNGSSMANIRRCSATTMGSLDEESASAGRFNPETGLVAKEGRGLAYKACSTKGLVPMKIVDAETYEQLMQRARNAELAPFYHWVSEDGKRRLAEGVEEAAGMTSTLQRRALEATGLLEGARAAVQRVTSGGVMSTVPPAQVERVTVAQKLQKLQERNERLGLARQAHADRQKDVRDKDKGIQKLAGRGTGAGGKRMGGRKDAGAAADAGSVADGSAAANAPPLPPSTNPFDEHVDESVLENFFDGLEPEDDSNALPGQPEDDSNALLDQPSSKSHKGGRRDTLPSDDEDDQGQRDSGNIDL